MNCQAKIIDEFGNKYKCLQPATKQITTKTFAPHLQKDVVKTRALCSTHAARLKSRFRYKVKHCGKQTIITEINL